MRIMFVTTTIREAELKDAQPQFVSPSSSSICDDAGLLQIIAT